MDDMTRNSLDAMDKRIDQASDVRSLKEAIKDCMHSIATPEKMGAFQRRLLPERFKGGAGGPPSHAALQGPAERAAARTPKNGAKGGRTA